MLLIACAQAQSNPLHPTIHFPTEKEVNDFLKVGIEKQAVAAKFGEPLSKDTHPNGAAVDEIYYYVQPPYKATKDENFVYGGFQVYFIKDKVSGFSIIHKDVRMPPK